MIRNTTGAALVVSCDTLRVRSHLLIVGKWHALVKFARAFLCPLYFQICAILRPLPLFFLELCATIFSNFSYVFSHF